MLPIKNPRSSCVSTAVIARVYYDPFAAHPCGGPLLVHPRSEDRPLRVTTLLDTTSPKPGQRIGRKILGNPSG